jgi:hypothetical protein
VQAKQLVPSSTPVNGIHFYLYFLSIPDTWIITGGTSAGVMQLVGEAVDDYTVTMRGIQAHMPDDSGNHGNTAARENKLVAIGIVTLGVIDPRAPAEIQKQNADRNRSLHAHVSNV